MKKTENNTENVLAAFFNLRTIPCKNIKFEKSYSGQGGFDYIKMIGLDEDGKQIWYSMIHIDSGQPITKVA